MNCDGQETTRPNARFARSEKSSRVTRRNNDRYERPGRGPVDDYIILLSLGRPVQTRDDCGRFSKARFTLNGFESCGKNPNELSRSHIYIINIKTMNKNQCTCLTSLTNRYGVRQE